MEKVTTWLSGKQKHHLAKRAPSGKEDHLEKDAIWKRQPHSHLVRKSTIWQKSVSNLNTEYKTLGIIHYYTLFFCLSTPTCTSPHAQMATISRIANKHTVIIQLHCHN